MRGVILEKENMFYTHMDEIFSRLNHMQLDYNWLISEYECNQYPDKRIPFNKEFVWISGKDLSQIVFQNKIQFIWGVFSAFDKKISLDDVLGYPVPYADENPGFWAVDFNIQHPLAELEIVSWDSSCLLLISKDDELIELFHRRFPLYEDLAVYNCKLLKC